jgi:glycerol-3-phosphate dehydrogenase
MLSKGLVPPLGTLPSAFTAERCHARAIAVLGGPSHAADAIENGASVVLASLDKSFSRQLSEVLTSAGLDITTTTDVTGVELAGCAKNVAALAAAAAGEAGGPNLGGAAAGKVFAEVERIARTRGGRSETFVGLAGAGDLVATVVAPGSRNRRAGELLGRGVPIEQIGPMLGQAVESVDTIALLTAVARDAHVETPALDSLAALVEGRIEPARWTATVTEPKKRGRSRSIRAA